MRFPTHRGVRGADRRPHAHRVSCALSVVALAAVVTGCTSAPSSSPTSPSSLSRTTSTSAPESTASQADGGAAAVISSLGAVPIPFAPAADPTPTASPAHPQLLAIGAPLTAVLSGGITALVVASGPDQLGTAQATASAPPQSTLGIITITAHVIRGSLTLHAADFTSRDQTGRAVPLSAHGVSMVTAAAGKSATLKVQGRFPSGAAQITWTHQKSVLSVWDFNIELD